MRSSGFRCVHPRKAVDLPKWQYLLQEGPWVHGSMGDFNATCCPDKVTGYPLGYTFDATGKRCLVVNETDFTNPLVKMLPRYRLCNATGIDRVYGMAVDWGASLAYYSSHGSIELLSSENN